MKLVIVFVVVILSTTLAASATNYFCNGEISAGFYWNGTNWKSTTFNNNGEQYTVSSVPSFVYFGKTITYKVTQLGKSSPYLFCEDAGNILCGGIAINFILNTTTLRFQQFYGIGYLDGLDQQGNTPSISAGKCSKISE